MPANSDAAATATPPGLERAAILVVDMQYADAHPDSAYVARRRARDGDAVAEYYTSRLRERVVPNVRRLVAAFRDAAGEVLFVRIQSLTADGRDRSPDHVRRGIHVPPGSDEARILPELLPRDDEIVLSKTSDSAFAGTGLADVLANLAVRDLVVVGVVTGSCVRATTLDAIGAVPGHVVVVGDATGTWSDAMQADAEREMAAAGASIVTTDELLELLARPRSVSESRTATP